jgi:hypothetical protein
MQSNINCTLNNKKFWLQKGQSIVEYTVVSVFGVLCLTTGPMRDIIVDLTKTIRNNYDGYSYAVSLSDYPDKENFIELVEMYNDQDMPSEQREYLTDNPGQLVEDLKEYALSALPPEIQDGIDIASDFGLSLDDFCDFCTGNPFDAL